VRMEEICLTETSGSLRTTRSYNSEGRTLQRELGWGLKRSSVAGPAGTSTEGPPVPLAESQPVSSQDKRPFCLVGHRIKITAIQGGLILDKHGHCFMVEDLCRARTGSTGPECLRQHGVPLEIDKIYKPTLGYRLQQPFCLCLTTFEDGLIASGPTTKWRLYFTE
jgi:hypothetical protein